MPTKGWTKLHDASYCNKPARVKSLLKTKPYEIDRTTPAGWTPLMLCSQANHGRIVKILLRNGASVSPANNSGITSIIVSSLHGHVEVTKMLIKGGADLEPTDSEGSTPLHLASEQQHGEVMKALLAGGADPNCRKVDGTTPLQIVARKGNVQLLKTLLHAQADPLIPTPVVLEATRKGRLVEQMKFITLETAARYGHVGIVRHLVQNVGIDKCGGKTKGFQALECAAHNGHPEVMAVLVEYGAGDDGEALTSAVFYAQEESVKFLLRQIEEPASDYINNTLDCHGRTPLMCALFKFQYPCALRIVRWLMDAGADTTSPVNIIDEHSHVVSKTTPMQWIEEKPQLEGDNQNEEDRQRLQAMRRLLLQKDAVQAVSWRWGLPAPCGKTSPHSTAKIKSFVPL